MEGLPAGDGLVYDPAYGSYVTADAGNLERLAQPLARKQRAERCVRPALTSAHVCHARRQGLPGAGVGCGIFRHRTARSRSVRRTGGSERRTAGWSPPRSGR